MSNLLISGPAGGGKSQRLKELLDESEEPTATADFQSLYAALLQQQRDPSGKYPLRDPALLPLVEYTRRSVITGARKRGIRILATNSDGDPERRGSLLDELGPDSEELVIDPGQTIAEDRLRSKDGSLSPECRNALQRWYAKKYRDNPRRRYRR